MEAKYRQAMSAQLILEVESAKASLLESNSEVINWLKTVESSLLITHLKVPGNSGIMRSMTDVTVGKNLNDRLTYAYIAGFLDGDGSVTAIIERHREKKLGFRVRISLDFYQHKDHVSVLKYIRRVFGEGYLGRSIRDTHKLSLRNQTSLKHILPLLLPYSHVKRNQIKIALRILSKAVVQKKDLIQVAQWADELSSHNVRSRSRRKNFSTMIV